MSTLIRTSSLRVTSCLPFSAGTAPVALCRSCADSDVSSSLSTCCMTITEQSMISLEALKNTRNVDTVTRFYKKKNKHFLEYQYSSYTVEIGTAGKSVSGSPMQLPSCVLSLQWSWSWDQPSHAQWWLVNAACDNATYRQTLVYNITWPCTLSTNGHSVTHLQRLGCVVHTAS